MAEAQATEHRVNCVIVLNASVRFIRSQFLLKESLLNTVYLWRVITHLGSAGLVLPVLTIVATVLWQTCQKRAVCIWLLSLSLAITLTLATKILFFGWGFGIAFLDFTGISGHTLLATSVLPVIFSWVLVSGQRRISVTGTVLGLTLSLGVGISRLVLGAHSLSEVVAAWIIGLIVSGLALNAMKEPVQRPWFAGLSLFALLLAFGVTTSNYLPTHDWEVELSLLLSGHSKPYSRHFLLMQTKLRQPSVGHVATN